MQFKTKRLNLSERDTSLIHKLSLKEIDHCIIQQDGMYYFIAHSNTKGQIVVNNQLCNTKDIENIVRQKLNLLSERNINIEICTCYGANIIPFKSRLTTIKSLVQNKLELFYKLIIDNFRASIDFRYLASE